MFPLTCGWESIWRRCRSSLDLGSGSSAFRAALAGAKPRRRATWMWCSFWTRCQRQISGPTAPCWTGCRNGNGYAGLCQEKGSSWPGSLRTSFNFAMIPGPSWGPWIRCWRKSRRGTSTGRSGQGLAMCTTCAPTIWSMKKAWTFCGTCINLLDLPSRPLPTCKRGNMPGRNRSCVYSSFRR